MTIEEYLLVSLMEECAEIQQAAAKALRFGLNDHHPERPEATNELELLTEVYQLKSVFDCLLKEGILNDLSEEKRDSVQKKKEINIEKYMYYAKEKGKIK